jgi:hypothetical protein
MYDISLNIPWTRTRSVRLQEPTLCPKKVDLCHAVALASQTSVCGQLQILLRSDAFGVGCIPYNVRPRVINCPISIASKVNGQ